MHGAGGDRLNSAGKDPFWSALLRRCPVAELAELIVPHGPQAAVRFHNQAECTAQPDPDAEITARRDRLNPAGENLLRRVTIGCRPIAKFTPRISPHDPQTSVGLNDQAVGITR